MHKLQASRKIKLAVLLDSYEIGGSAKVVLQNLKAAPEDFDVLVVLFSRSAIKSSPLIEKLRENSINYEVVQESSAFDLRIVFKVIKILKGRSVNIIESNHYKTHLLALFASKFLKIPWIAVSHGWTAENAKVKFYNLLDRFSLYFCNTAVALGPSIAKKLENILKKSSRVRCLPTAFDPNCLPQSVAVENLKEKYEVSDSCFLFAAAGRLSYEKGFDILLEAASVLVQSKKDFLIIIFGSGVEEVKLKKKAANLQLANQVKFLGQKSSEELFSYYSQFDCVVIPSRSEGLPNVLLEAAYSNLPVIASDVGGIPDFMKGEIGKWLFSAGDYKRLADLMNNIIELPENQRNQLGLKFKERLIDAYTADKRTKKVYRLYRALIRKMHAANSTN